MTEDQLQEQLGHLKQITIRTGVLHDAQVFQLQMWPLMLFEAYSSTAKVDIANKSVIFDIDVKKPPLNKIYIDSKKKLTQWCRNLLWNETEIDINFKVKTNEKRTRTKSKR